jgi:hypothetical protein
MSTVAEKLYTTLADGRLQEKIVFDSAPAIPQVSAAQADTSAPPQFRLMVAPPVVPRSSGNGLILASNLTLPKGNNPLRTAGGLLFLTVAKTTRATGARWWCGRFQPTGS